MSLTKKAIKKYVENKGLVCPYCGSRELHTGTIDNPDVATFSQNIKCLTCEKEWDDAYTLTGIYEVES